MYPLPELTIADHFDLERLLSLLKKFRAKNSGQQKNCAGKADNIQHTDKNNSLPLANLTALFPGLFINFPFKKLTHDHV